MKKKYFGTDGIRGLVNKHPITAEMILKFGIAAGKFFIKNDNSYHRMIIGRDTRISGYMIENALSAGLASVGMNVLLLGLVPTPAIAMLTRSLRADAGIMISASHNQFYDNGIKLFGPDGYKLDDNRELKIESLIDEKLNNLIFTKPFNLGKVCNDNTICSRYIEFIKHTINSKIRFNNLKIVIDSANGAAYKIAPVVLWELGAEIIEIGNKPNGFNINKKCGSISLELLQKKVLIERADIGIALDGDADRVIIIDEKGNIVNGDQLIAVITKNFKKKNLLHKNGIVTTVMANLGLEYFINNIGLKLIRTNVGDRYVLECMNKYGYNVGGEQSGHIILLDYNTISDGLITAIQIISFMIEFNMRASDVCKSFEPIPQILKNVYYDNNGDDPLLNKLVQKVIKDSKLYLNNHGHGRILIRKSGTEPVIRIMAEGNDIKIIEQVVNNIISSII